MENEIKLFNETTVSSSVLAGIYGIDDLPLDAFPLTYKIIAKYKRKGKEIVLKLKKKYTEIERILLGGGTT